MTVENTLITGTSWLCAAAAVCFIILSHKDIHISFRVLSSTFVMVGAAAFVAYIANVNFEKEMRRNYGRLYPSNIVGPNSRCAPGEDIELFAGHNNFQISVFPYTFLSIDGDPIITLGRSGSTLTPIA